jgi:AcrR family transcriptional regulator
MKPRRSRKNDLVAAAERLFAECGFHGATLRDITAAASVPLGLATYYFGSKEFLFQAVLERREPQLRAALTDALDQALAETSAPAAEPVIAAYLSPHLKLLRADEGWRDYFQILNQLAGFDDRVLRGAALFTSFHAVLERFVDVLAAALPGVPKKRIADGMVMMRMLQMSFYAESLSGRAARDVDRLPLDLLPMLIRFCTAGFIAAVSGGDGQGQGNGASVPGGGLMPHT